MGKKKQFCKIIKLLKKKGIDIKNNKNNYTISNSIDQDLKYTPYCEIIYTYDEITKDSYVYVSVNNTIGTIVVADLYIDNNSALINDKRFWMANLTISLNETFEYNSEYPDFKYLYFLNPNYDSTNSSSSEILDIYATFKKKTTSKAIAVAKYTETEIFRTSAFVYYPLNTLYLLVNTSDPLNIKIYVMQSFTNQINTTINSTSLPYLKSLLTLPDGWMFVLFQLDSETSLLLTANESTPAYVIQDDFNNTYQYAPISQAPFLYTQFTK
jgi:hypothetical protein